MNRAAAIAFLLGRQSPDGGFKSTTYGPLKAGAATTALTLYAFAHLPEAEWRPHRDQLQRACKFLEPGIVKHGAVAAADGTLDYPTYGSAMLLVALKRLKLDLPEKQRVQIIQFLLADQLGAGQGVEPTSIHYGGWDLDATTGARGDSLKTSNISLASFALEALSEVKRQDAATAIERGRHWVLRCQNPDGGFVFHAWRRHPGNKAKWSDDGDQAISYATPTCDGLRALKYCGVSDRDEALRKTIQWLAEHPDASRVPGFEAQAQDQGWDAGLRYYYFYTQAKALAFLPPAEARRRAEAIEKILAKAQRPDGSFKNEQPRMFEDDPLLATCLALIADAEARTLLAQPTKKG